MPTLVLLAVISMFLALALYAIGVWSQIRARRLEGRHLTLFWAGLAADAFGTALMFHLAGHFTVSLHSISGLVVLVLMVAHNAAATFVLLRRHEWWLCRFYRVSLAFWVIWLVPFLSGLVSAGHR